MSWRRVAAGGAAGMLAVATVLTGAGRAAAKPGAAQLGVALDASHLYWTTGGSDTGTVDQANLDGGSRRTLVRGQAGPVGVAVG